MYKTPNIPLRVGVILGVTLLFIGGLAAFLFWYLGGQEKAATQEANKFISALVKHDESAAPRNGDDYVRGVWQAYRRVDDAKLIKTRQKSSNHSNSNGSSPLPTPRLPVTPVRPPKFKTPPVIKCIRRAHRDVLKIQKCAKLVHS